MTVLSPLWLISEMIAAGPVTYAVTPGGGRVRPTMFRTASVDAFAKVEAGMPARFTCTYAALLSTLCAADAVSGSPQKSWMCRTCFGSSFN